MRLRFVRGGVRVRAGHGAQLARGQDRTGRGASGADRQGIDRWATMAGSRLELKVRAVSDEPPWELAPHVLTRLVRVLIEQGSSYRGARVERGIAAITAGVGARTVTAALGYDIDRDGLLLRLEHEDRRPAWLSVATIVLVTSAATWGLLLRVEDGQEAARLMGAALLVALIAGLVVFHLARAVLARGGSPTRGPLSELDDALRAELGPLGVEVEAVTGGRMYGLDVEPGRARASEIGDDALRVGDMNAWNRVMYRAIGAIPH